MTTTNSGATLTNLNASNLASGTVPATQMPALSGDVTSAAGSTATTVGKIQGVTVSTTAPANGQVLAYNSTSSKWEPTTGSGSTPTYTIKSTTITYSGNSIIVINSVTCPSGKVTGGGYMIDDADAMSYNFTVTSSYPSSDTTWTVKILCTNETNMKDPASVMLYAICAS